MPRAECPEPTLSMVAAEAHGKQMKVIENHCERHFTPRWESFGLSRPWLVPVQLGLGFTEAIAVAMDSVPARRPAAPARRQEPRSTMNKVG